MKKLEFTTSKGEFIIVDSIGRENYYEVLRSEGMQVYHIGMVREMAEEQFAEVVDSELDSHLNPNYKDYLHDRNSGFEDKYTYYTAKQSFESLIKSLGWYLFRNPVQVSISTLTDVGQAYRPGCQESESKTFYNPIILKKV